MEFEEALKLMKEGKTMYRTMWNNPNIRVRVQFPDGNSMNTEPYLVMEKDKKCFPLDLSCESIFADDWEMIK